MALVLEAADHIGGRCVTDMTTFATPFDRGGSWLHTAAINPLARRAEALGIPLHKTEWDWRRVHALGHDLSPSEVAAYRAYQEAMWTDIHASADPNADRAIEAALPGSPWRETAKHWVTMHLGGNADAASVVDSATYAEAEGDWLVEGGLGAFIAQLHADVPVQCGCSVTSIDYSGPRASVETTQGTVQADQVVLTVSTGVLAAEAIRFDPGLPTEKLTAIDGLPNGLLNKVGIEFDPAWREAILGDCMDYHPTEAEFCTLQFGFYGSTLAVGFVGGRCADQLEIDGAGAATALCRDALRSFFGSDVDKRILRTSETAWRSNTLTVGSYSFAKPGGAGGRRVLAEPIEDRLFFAGEATMPESYSTVHGAYLSGQRVAREILEARGRRAAG